MHQRYMQVQKLLSQHNSTKFTLKLKKKIPKFETFLALKSLFVSILCCQKALIIIQNLQQFF